MPKPKKQKKMLHKLLKNPSIAASRFSRPHLIIFSLIFACIGGYAIYSSFAAGPSSTANIFVSTNGSNSGINCKRFATATTNPDPSGTTLCASFNEAYILASPGDDVEIMSGDYGEQSINGLTKTSSTKIIFAPDSLGQVKIPQNSSTLSSALTLPAATIAVNNVSAFLAGSDGKYQLIVGDRLQITPTTAQSVTCTGKNISAGTLTGCTGGSVSAWTSGAPVIEPGGLSIAASNIEIDSMTVGGGVGVSPASSNPSDMTGVTFRNVNALSVFVRGNYTSWYGGDVGGYNACEYGSSEDAFRLWQDGVGNSTDHVIVSGATIHDNSVDSGSDSTCGGKPTSGLHADCMQMLGGNNALIEKNNFYNCPTSDIIARPFRGANLHGNILRNNFLGNVLHPGSNAGFGGSGDVCGGPNIIEYNTVNGTVSGYCSEGVTIKGNILLGAPGGCPGTWTNNILPTHLNSGITCGSPVKVCDPLLADPTEAKGNLHLAAGDTCAVGAGDQLNCPADDIDGDTRPQGGSCDAGADEYLSGTPPPPPAAPTLTLSASPTSLSSGSASTLTWTSTNTTSCTASGSWSGSKATSGTASTGNLSTSSTYTLTCTGAGGSANASASVTVNALPPPPAPATTQKGDCNGDGHVTLVDLSILLSHYNGAYSPADFDSSGAVTLVDLSILVSNYGK